MHQRLYQLKFLNHFVLIIKLLICDHAHGDLLCVFVVFICSGLSVVYAEVDDVCQNNNCQSSIIVVAPGCQWFLGTAQAIKVIAELRHDLLPGVLSRRHKHFLKDSVCKHEGFIGHSIKSISILNLELELTDRLDPISMWEPWFIVLFVPWRVEHDVESSHCFCSYWFDKGVK